MKVYGVGIEFTVELSEQEIELLKRKDIVGKMKIRDHQSEYSTEIDFQLSVRTTEEMQDKIRSDGVFVNTLPMHTYFPLASKVELYLGDETLESLSRRHFYVTRFNTGGKVSIYNKDKSEYY